MKHKRWKSKAARAARRDYELMSHKVAPTTRPRSIIIKPHQITLTPTKPIVFKTLTASNEFWSEKCQWEMKDSIWKCTAGTGVLKRLVGMNQLEAKNELLRLGANWSWD